MLKTIVIVFKNGLKMKFKNNTSMQKYIIKNNIDKNQYNII